jgi:hypothetical protein
VKWLWILLFALCALAMPCPVDSAVFVGITATGEEIGALPGAPTNFTAILISNQQVNLTWTKGGLATNTVIRAQFGSYPTSVTDGYLVYNGPGTSVTDWVDLANSDEALYYRAWSWNTVGYSIGYDGDYVEGGGVGMTQALILIPLVFIALGLTVAGYSRQERGWPIVFVAALAWLCLPVWGFTQADSATDIYALVGFVGVVMIIICAFEPMIMRKEKPQLSIQEKWEQRENAMLGPRRRMRGRDDA